MCLLVCVMLVRGDEVHMRLVKEKLQTECDGEMIKETKKKLVNRCGGVQGSSLSPAGSDWSQSGQ